jgi:tetratricopeptide (TPR) repeat protein
MASGFWVRPPFSASALTSSWPNVLANMADFAYGWTSPEIDYDAKILAQADRAIALAPNNWWAYYAKCIYLFLSRRANEAVDVADAGLAVNPNFAPLYAARGNAETSLGRFEQAESDVRQAMRLSPRDPRVGTWLFFIGSAELEQGHYDAAIDELHKARASAKADFASSILPSRAYAAARSPYTIQARNPTSSDRRAHDAGRALLCRGRFFWADSGRKVSVDR